MSLFFICQIKITFWTIYFLQFYAGLLQEKMRAVFVSNHVVRLTKGGGISASVQLESGTGLQEQVQDLKSDV